MAASAPLSGLFLTLDRSSGQASSSSGPPPMWLNQRLVEELQVGRCSPRQFGATARGLGHGRRVHHVMGAKRPGKDRNGGVAQAVEEVKIPDNSEPDDMYMGRKLEGLEPDFWEGEQWDKFGFFVQYSWAFGIAIALAACGVAVTSYNSGATDIRDTDVFKEALENEVEVDSALESGSTNAQDFPEVSEAPPLQ